METLSPVFSPQEREHGVTDVKTVSGQGGKEIMLVQEAASKEGMRRFCEKFKKDNYVSESLKAAHS